MVEKRNKQKIGGRKMTNIKPNSKIRTIKQKYYCKRTDGTRSCSWYGWKNQGETRYCVDCGHTVTDKTFMKLIGKADWN